MAHSSGGGGGSIGGGGGHSSYHSSSGSGSGSSSNPRKTSNKYFHNSRCFCYYDQYGNEQYIYADYDMVAADKPRWIMGIIVAVFSLFIFVPTFVSLIKESKPIDSSDVKGPKYNIEDNLGVIEDKDKVEDAMSEFYKLSGVHLEIVTEFPEAWKRADDLESYALDLYYDSYDDEKHWLIVYSEEEDEDTIYYSFEGIQGDDTDGILNVEVTDKFNRTFMDYLEDGEDVDKSFIKAYGEASEILEENSWENKKTTLIVAMVVVFLGIGGFTLGAIFGGTRKYKNIHEDTEYLKRKKEEIIEEKRQKKMEEKEQYSEEDYEKIFSQKDDEDKFQPRIRPEDLE